MARYNIAYRTVDGTIATPNSELRATSSDRPLLVELELHCVSAPTAPLVVGIGVPALIGVAPTSSYRVVAEDTANPLGTTIVATAWTVAPTVPANFFRRLNLKSAIGAPLIVGFPRGLGIMQSSSLVFWNVTTNPLFDVSVTVDE